MLPALANELVSVVSTCRGFFVEFYVCRPPGSVGTCYKPLEAGQTFLCHIHCRSPQIRQLEVSQDDCCFVRILPAHERQVNKGLNSSP